MWERQERWKKPHSKNFITKKQFKLLNITREVNNFKANSEMNAKHLYNISIAFGYTRGYSANSSFCHKFYRYLGLRIDLLTCTDLQSLKSYKKFEDTIWSFVPLYIKRDSNATVTNEVSSRKTTVIWENCMFTWWRS